MNFTGIYIYIDGYDLKEVSEPMLKELNSWISAGGYNYQVINDKYEKSPDEKPNDYPIWNIGININKTESISNDLEIAIPYLTELGIKYKRELALGYYDAITNISEDIAFIGYELKNENTVDIVKQLLCI
ncbi:hypothetical protein [Sedimenticola selenatireducens]|uniref:Uncharacterized protein n=1 Tax=Sedimenticola selenatireducens TaxID=191960 RepID=A0A558DJM3_9GAMM|nr:hypothetical protein [Sedimenticola selenatireducens]TVO68850.1 hypothetical protein FHP88_18180 [Sedimenticola selenatireducens]TVT61222.1 MAG: hypothetical protein FHK78_18145 [Sedimenticola selenatireducens]